MVSTLAAKNYPDFFDIFDKKAKIHLWNKLNCIEMPLFQCKFSLP